MIKERKDLTFLFLTKRIERFLNCIPMDWGNGYDNVIIGCTVENQAAADSRLSIFDKLPIIHKNIICQPLLQRINLSSHLNTSNWLWQEGKAIKMQGCWIITGF